MDASGLTEQILKLWKESEAFRASIDSRSTKLSYTFYDGPPFTSGDPHYGHLLQSIVKDMIPRWMTMRGYRVTRKRGRDCHGIPAENFVNKQLGITSRKQVEEEFGIGNYIEACRNMVNQVNENWKRTVDHVGRRVDMENAYFTMDNEYMESVICVFSDLYHRNLIYKGFKVLGYSRALGTALSNSEIMEGYEMRQDPAVTVKLPLKNRTSEKKTTGAKSKKKIESFENASNDNAIQVAVGVVKDADGRYLMLFENNKNTRYFPGGKIEPGELPADALRREFEEELAVKITTEKFLGHAKTIHNGKLYRIHYFLTEFSGTPTIQEPTKHGMFAWVGKVPAENELGYGLKFDHMVIDEITQLRHEFADVHMLEQGLPNDREAGDAPVCLLPRTTTPRTLPSNMFAAVHQDITYVEIYDPAEKCYFVLSKGALPNYYKSTDAYIPVGEFLGKELVGLGYTPLFDYYAQADSIPTEYKTQVHRVLHADFVTTETGTGIAHEAPAFGADDYELVCTVFPREKAQERLFDPVNAYGEFTDLVPDFAGQNVIEANGAVIKELKSRGLLVKHETINHSYPHCPRTGTPIIYKAVESRFIKEEELKKETIPAAQEIHFVPENVKQRFINILESAPDWNISRTRFRGCPLPVRQSADGEVTKVVGSLEEIYQLNKSTKQLTKVILVRHGKTDYNEKRWLDCADKARLGTLGEQQAEALCEQLRGHEIDAVYSSPLTRCTTTIGPYCSSVSKTPVIDDRLYEVRMPALQDKPYDKGDRSYDSGIPVDKAGGETLQQVAARGQEFLREVVKKHAGETVVICGHGDPLLGIMKGMWGFDYDKDLHRWYPPHAHPIVYYVRSDSAKGLDLHRPYIDEVILIDPETGKELRRIPEVLDCRFESGSMPYGQDHFMNGKFSNCADFIAEGLDQTRGWFHALHILGHAYHHQNVFRNVAVTGMILAEDGKKMSKRLGNYPDPKELLTQYGADPLRLYLLSSPVVRSEPLRFSEKAVEQMLKDVVIPLQNVVNFFKLYAEADKRTDAGTQVRFMRHAEKQRLNIAKELPQSWVTEEGETVEDIDLPLSEAGVAQLTSPEFIEKVVRIDPEVIICSEFVRAHQTAVGAQQVMENYLGKKIEIVETSDRGLDAKRDDLGDTHNTKEEGEHNEQARSVATIYAELLSKYAGKRVLIVGHKRRFRYLWQRLGHLQEDINTPEANKKYFLQPTQVIPLPMTQIINDLDQRILAELHRTIGTVDTALGQYEMDVATKELISFVDKLTNWYLRRSRRRFWSEEMDADKQQAYSTLFTVLRTYLQLVAPFIPFTAEGLRQDLKAFTQTPTTEHPSIHLQTWPIAAPIYIDQQLIEEIGTVRKIIKGAMYLRAKHQIKVKQPLSKLEVRIP